VNSRSILQIRHADRWLEDLLKVWPRVEEKAQQPYFQSVLPKCNSILENAARLRAIFVDQIAAIV